jgi:hypothetical protein
MELGTLFPLSHEPHSFVTDTALPQEITNSMELGPSREAASRSSCQEFPYIYLNLKVQ